MKRSLFAILMDKWNIHIWRYYITFKVTFDSPKKRSDRYRIPYLTRICKLTGKRQEICILFSEKLPTGKINNWKDVKNTQYL
jgi:hypothetical protein